MVGWKRVGRNGVRVVVMMRRTAVGMAVAGLEQAVRIRSRGSDSGTR